jgi:uncharacterized membrane protein YecN with MAPEG domain
MTTFPITSIYAGLLAMLLMVLGALVTRARVVHKVDLGDGGKVPVLQSMRVHANFAEYVPLAVVVIGLLEANGQSVWVLHALGGGLLVGRLAHAWGLTSSPGLSPGRFVGTNLTWLVLLAGGALLVVAAVWDVKL